MSITNETGTIEAFTPAPGRRRRAEIGGVTEGKPTAKRVAANRANARKSTGPTSPEGKAVSARNALKHGFRANVVAVPGEDPAVFEARSEAWGRELNPRGDAAADYAVAILVRTSENLDRLHVARTARVAGAARDARRDRDEARAREAEGLLRGLPDDPATVVRRLRRTTEGCRALIARWELMEAALIAPARWDDDDADRAHNLRGLDASGTLTNTFRIAAEAIDEHRVALERLAEAVPEEDRMWDDTYDEDAMRADRDRLPALAEASARAAAWVAALIASEKAGLTARIEELSDDERLDADEAPLRARLDASDEGRLLHRYESDAHRLFLRTYAALKAEAQATVATAQVQIYQEFTSERLPDVPASPSGPDPVAPNEPIRAVPMDRGVPIRAALLGPDPAAGASPAAPIHRPDRE